MIDISYSEVRARLAEVLDRVTRDREVVRIRRQGGKPSAVLLDADEFASLEETAYLLSSPANARHILRALVELDGGQTRAYDSVSALWLELEGEARAAPGQVPQTTDFMAALRTSLKSARQRKARRPPASGATTN